LKGEKLQKTRERSEPEIRELAQQIEAKLQAIRRILRRQLDREYAKGDLTVPQRMVMEVLVQSNGLSVKELSYRVDLAHSTVSGIVDRLEKKGLIERRTAVNDRRLTLVTVSEAVRIFLDKRAPDLTRAPLMRALKRATRAERVAVQDGLETLARLLGNRGHA
jgi:DNA-binding MarR family transcriptional regulator